MKNWSLIGLTGEPTAEVVTLLLLCTCYCGASGRDCGDAVA